ncbi:MAG TPA: hypothetical protein ENJ12_12195 [Thiolapillus brandeum]|uniref:Uncharacterized protein n=1 Tax=Thiolapillus brandeum TaxID=1076588 RepID=A0A831WDW7_9GAMM|nr:hypothetical protein [Thiolapillus brandeum]
MTQSNQNPLPEWRAAWRVDDPAWMKARRAEWRRLQGRIKYMVFNQRELTMLKNYFMYGCAHHPELPQEKWKRESYTPERGTLWYPDWGPVQDRLLYELWLTPDKSEKNSQRLLNVYDNIYERDRARDRFRKEMGRDLEHLSEDLLPLFDGEEHRLYRLLGPTRCRREDYPDETDEQYIKICDSSYSECIVTIERYLRAEVVHDWDTAPLMVPEFCDAFEHVLEAWKMESQGEPDPEEYYQERLIFLQYIIQSLHNVVDNPDTYKPEQVDVARAVLKCISSHRLPEQVESAVGDLLLR